MNFYRRHWYDVGGILALMGIACLAFFWNRFEMLARLQLLSFVALLVHQFEEYGFPGGEPAIMNIALRNSDIPDRYPLNQQSAMITNVAVAYPLYFLPILFPRAIWLGLIPMLFGFGQIIVHGIMTNIKMKSFYNPGLGAVLLLHFPIGIYYIHYIGANGLASWIDWLVAIAGLLIVMAVGVNGLTYKLLPDRNSKYPFAPEEMRKFRVAEKLARIAF
jgi:hypothetical protein